MSDDLQPEPPDPESESRLPARSLVAWILLGAGALVMTVGMAVALKLSARPSVTAAPSSTPASIPASASVRVPRAPPVLPRLTPSSSPPVVAERPKGPRVTAEDRAAMLPVEPELPLWGDANALVTVMLFGDLECPHTHRALAALERLKRRFGPDLRIAFRHRPIKSNGSARQAGVTAAALHTERGDDAFWSLALDLAQHPPPASLARFESWARRTGEDPARVSAWAASEPAALRVEGDVGLAVRFGVRKTPTFFVNGERIEGFEDDDQLSLALAHGVAQALAAMGEGVARPSLYARLTAKNLVGVGSQSWERTCPSIDGSPVRGRADALLTVVFFADFACEYCRKAVPLLAELSQLYGPELRLVYKSLPHPDHAASVRLARFAEEAFERGGAEAFWRVYDALYRARGELDETELRSIAEGAGLASAPLLAASRQASVGPKLESVAKEAEALEVDGTPTLFVNGVRFDGLVARATLLRHAAREAALMRRLLEHPIERTRLYQVICPRPKPADPADGEPDDDDPEQN